MRKKLYLATLFAIMALTACGTENQQGTGNPTQNGAVESTVESGDGAGQPGGTANSGEGSEKGESEETSSEENNGGSNQDAQPSGEGDNQQTKKAISLEDYAWQMSHSNLGYYSMNYVKSEDGYWWEPDLNNMSDFQEGAVFSTFADMDRDAQDELLVVEAVRVNTTQVDLYLTIYEEENGSVEERSSARVFEDVLGEKVDVTTMRFFLKDDQYFLADREAYSLSYDGVQYDESVFSYDGKALQCEIEFSEVGSDFYGSGADHTDIAQAFEKIGLTKTAKAFRERDNFSICVADAGVEPIAKLYNDNALLEGEDEYPYYFMKSVSGYSPADEFILPDSATRELTQKELQYYTKEELKLARNEIYARYGWNFKSEELKSYFEYMAWYRSGENIDDEVLSEVEKKNRDLIAKMEKTAPEHRDVKALYGTQLTEAELEEISELLNSMEYNGCLRTLFKDVRDVNLDEVFYNGAGMGSDFDVEEYLRVSGEEEIYTDITAISSQELKNYLKEKFGYSLKEMRSDFGWLYLADSDVYAFEHGDTNYSPVELQEGYQDAQGNVAVVYVDSWSYEWDEDPTQYLLTLHKEGNTYRMVSNEKY